MIKNNKYSEIKKILSNRPKLHELKNELQDWGISEELAMYIVKESEGKKTLEVGSGLSTIVFLLASDFHTCINPNKSDKERLLIELNKQKIDSNRLNFVNSKSEFFCPKLEDFYDVILIDGSHTFPWPIIDWYYSGMHLKKNGIMILDDVDWWPVGIVDSYMKNSSLWKFKFGNERFSCFEALEQGEKLISHRWEQQPNILGALCEKFK